MQTHLLEAELEAIDHVNSLTMWTHSVGTNWTRMIKQTGVHLARPKLSKWRPINSPVEQLNEPFQWGSEIVQWNNPMNQANGIGQWNSQMKQSNLAIEIGRANRATERLVQRIGK